MLTKDQEKLSTVKAKKYFDSLNGSFPIEKFIKAWLPEENTFSIDNEIRVDKNYVTKWIQFLNTTSKKYLSKFVIQNIVEEFESLLPSHNKPNIDLDCSQRVFMKDDNFKLAFSRHIVSEWFSEYVDDLVSNIQVRYQKIMFLVRISIFSFIS